MFLIKFLKTKCLDALNLNTTHAQWKHFYKLLQPTFVNFLPLPTTMHQLLLTIYHSSLNWSNPKYFLYFTKKSFFLHSLKIVICSRLLNFRLYVYSQELFIISWKKFHLLEHFSYPFVTEHHINLSLVFNPLFISSICCQSLVLFIRPKRHLVIDCL